MRALYTASPKKRPTHIRKAFITQYILKVFLNLDLKYFGIFIRWSYTCNLKREFKSLGGSKSRIDEISASKCRLKIYFPRIALAKLEPCMWSIIQGSV
jgi:hypothetical protein